MQARARAWAQGNPGAAATSPPTPHKEEGAGGRFPPSGVGLVGGQGSRGQGPVCCLVGGDQTRSPVSGALPVSRVAAGWGAGVPGLLHTAPRAGTGTSCAQPWVHLDVCPCQQEDVWVTQRCQPYGRLVRGQRQAGVTHGSGRGAGSLKGHAAARRQRTRFLQGALLPTPEPQG